MEYFEFYKSKFEREQKRRVDLDNATNLPIVVSTLVMGLNSYVVKEHIFNKIWNFWDSLIVILLIGSAFLILISSYFIFIAVNNLFKGFDYPNFELMSKYREIEVYNRAANDNDKMDFKEIITDKIISYSDESTIINDKRADYLFKARKFIIINFLATIINLILVTALNLLK